MVKRRNSRYQAFQWGAPRRVPIDCTPQSAPPMRAAPPGRTRLRRAWSKGNPGGGLAIELNGVVLGGTTRQLRIARLH